MQGEQSAYKRFTKVIFFQILIYKIGFMQGEQSAYKRFTKVCNVCRNKDK